ncbi:MAG: hypothetical protein ACI4B3_08170 [Prevotella sp.]
MKRKLFSAILFGALLTASTSGLTSCKDYDDDISNLQSQIDKLATKDELAAKATELSNAIANAQSAATAAKQVADEALAAAKSASSAADAAKSAADAAKSAADAAQSTADAAQKDAEKVASDLKAATEAAASQIAEAVKGLATKAEVEAAVKTVSDEYDAQAKQLKALEDRIAAVESKLSSAGEGTDLSSIQKELEAIENSLKALGVSVSAMITDIQLFPSYGMWDAGFDTDINFIQAKEVATYNWTVFGDQEKFEFTEGNQYIGKDQILVRVSPVNAVLTKENVSLINSQGANADAIVEIESVEKYEGLLTTRSSASETGLWVVTLKAKSIGDDFYAATVDKSQGYERKVLFAVAAQNDDKNISANRCVTSEYDLTLSTQVASHGYDFAVNGKNINDIHNRYFYCDDNTPTYDKVNNPSTYAEELTWLEVHRPYAKVVTEDGPNKNAADRYYYIDNRQSEQILAVEKGNPITIDFGVNGDENVKGFYVTLDERFALESSPSEINAWTSYEYENVGYTKANGDVVPAKLFNGNVGTIVIKNTNNVAGDIIGFRVYAVNYDGTLSDPDGRAFYVAVGDVKTEVTIPQVEVTYQDFNGTLQFVSDYVAVDDAFSVEFNKYKARADYGYPSSANAFNAGWISVTKDDDDQIKTFDVKYYDENKAEISASQIAIANVGRDKIKYVRFVLSNPGQYIDGATYKQSITLQKYTSSSMVATTDVRTINVSIKKVMPTGPAFQLMAGQAKEQWLMPTWNGANSDYTIEAGKHKNATIDLNNFLVSEKNLYAGGLQALKTEDGNYTFTVVDGTYVYGNPYYISNAIVDATGGARNQIYTLDVYNVPSAWTGTAMKNLIDNTTEHNISAYYTYSGISKRIETVGGVRGYYDDLDYNTPSSSSEKVVYCSWTKNFSTDLTVDNKWNEKSKGYDKNTLTWAENPSGTQTLDLNDVVTKIGGAIIPSVKPASASLGALITDNYLTIINPNDTRLVVSGQVNPYFKVNGISGSTITFEQTNQTTQPTSAHEETLELIVEDCFGNQFTISLPVQVK